MIEPRTQEQILSGFENNYRKIKAYEDAVYSEKKHRDILPILNMVCQIANDIVDKSERAKYYGDLKN